MHLIENEYEKAGMIALPPHARDIAEHFLTLKPLSELLWLLQENQPDIDLLWEHKVPKRYWLEIIKAAILAKTTYFLANPDFTKEEILFLLKAACISVDMPLTIYTLAEVIEMNRSNRPIFSRWLTSFAQQLKHLKSLSHPA